ncbi:hypothetical protein GCM10027030_20180 [Luteococcus sediminum]|uniref:DUF4235 domain-containing protein n=1 Tax=Luteococcus sp. TaxID=1969402 RepID=UPI003736E7CC
MASLSQNLSFKIYAGVLGAVTTIATQQALKMAWKAVTGDTPPDPNDPDTPPTYAAIWAVASAAGLGVSQIVLNRYVSRRYEATTGEHLDTSSKSKIKI